MAKKTFLQFIKERIQRDKDNHLLSPDIDWVKRNFMHVLLYDMDRDMKNLEERKTGQAIYDRVCFLSTYQDNRILMGKLARQYMAECLTKKIRFERINLCWER